jgi:peptide/nickel transport system permease protein
MTMEAAISFLGMGLPPHMPSPGTMLAYAMNGVLLGHWWQAFLPGMMLVITLVLVHACVVTMKKEAL